jgi:hypothetical protein
LKEVNTKPKHLKKLIKPTQEKIGFKKSPALQKIKNTTHSRLDNYTETQYCHWFARTVDRRPAYNNQSFIMAEGQAIKLLLN